MNKVWWIGILEYEDGRVETVTRDGAPVMINNWRNPASILFALGHKVEEAAISATQNGFILNPEYKKMYYPEEKICIGQNPGKGYKLYIIPNKRS